MPGGSNIDHRREGRKMGRHMATWAVFDSRKSCDHMCFLSSTLFCFCGSLFLFSPMDLSAGDPRKSVWSPLLPLAFGDFHQFASRQLSTRCMCRLVHFACALAFTMAHASTARQPFSRAFVLLVNLTVKLQSKNQRLGNLKPGGPSFVGIDISL